MNFIFPIFYGIPQNLYQDCNPEEKIEASRSTYSYEGKITQDRKNELCRFVELDNGAVQIYMLPEKARNEKISALCSISLFQGFSFVVNTGGAALLGVNSYRHFQSDEKLGFTALSLAGMIGCSVLAYRNLSLAITAFYEGYNWNNTVSIAQEKRKFAANPLLGFHYTQNLVGTIVTKEESQDLYFRLAECLKKQIFSSSTEGEKVQALNNLVVFSPLNQTIVEDTFGQLNQSDKLINPKDLKAFSNISQATDINDDIVTKFHSIVSNAKKKTKKAEKETEQKQAIVNISTLSTHLVVEEARRRAKDATEDNQTKETVDTVANIVNISTSLAALASHANSEYKLETKLTAIESSRNEKLLSLFPKAKELFNIMEERR